MLSRRILLGFAMAGSFAMNGPVLAQDKIKIGAVLAVTGPASFLGDPEAKTLKMLAEECRKQGGRRRLRRAHGARRPLAVREVAVPRAA